MSEESQEEVEVVTPQQGANVASKNWKAGLKFWKIPDMPASDYKKPKKK